MPDTLRYDPQVIAACESLQPELIDLAMLSSFANLYGNIDILPESILQYMAWENGVFGAEWAMAGNIEKRRVLIQNSFLLNKLRGTKWSLLRIFEVLGLHAEIVEWWEEDAEPFTFRISVLDISGVGLTPQMNEWINTLIFAYKPLTRHITETNVYRALEKTSIKPISTVKMNNHFTV